MSSQQMGGCLLHLVSNKRWRYVIGVTSKSPEVNVGSIVMMPNSLLLVETRTKAAAGQLPAQWLALVQS